MEENSRSFEEAHEESHAASTWQENYHSIMERLWIVILCFVLGLAAAAFSLKSREVRYQARAVLFLEQNKGRILDNVEEVRDEQIRTVDMINTVVDSIQGSRFALRVADRLKLGTDPVFLAAIKSTDKEVSSKEVTGHLLQMVKAGFRKSTVLIDITATTRDPQLSVQLANGYANEFIRMRLEQRTDSTQLAGEFLVEEAARLGKKMRLSEEALQSFRERERAASLETMLIEAQTQVQTLSEQIQQTEKISTALDRDLSAAKGREDDVEFLLELSSIVAIQQMEAMNTAIESQQAELDLLSQRYLSDHPLYSTLNAKLQLALKARKELLETIFGQLEARRDQVQKQIESLQTAKTEAEKRLLEVTGKSIEYNSLTRELDADKALYEAVLNRLKEVDLTKGIADATAKIHEQSFGAATLPIKYVKILLLGAFGGFGLGAGIAILLGKLDPALRSIEHTEDTTGFKVITAIPQMKALSPGLVTLSDRHGFIAEAFRTLRTSVALVPGRRDNKVFLFTSAVPGEGKTFASSNFAVTLSQQGFRTIYVDADLRNPGVSQILFGENRKPGLTEVLLGKAKLEEAVLPGNVENLFVLTAGEKSANPSEILAGPHMRELFEALRDKYDRIVIDSAPIIPVSDTLHLVGLIDAVCLVVRAQSTPKKSVQYAIRLLCELNNPPSGIILNGLRETRGGYYSYHYSGRAYRGYGEKGSYGKQD